ncbi:DUF1254 domain-containing protein [Vibrio ulleungensis]|uniref:DUF1254 domain-containing protein n=1 Tax=Vibrio ulleungensis TaxID=2807619 RepID=A0ABS2HC55_9VIBR|nr:DUF1254 domain-containing protein [Vibrio ulleungensis]MBM7035185.1 DUF1254 domain-containing protein [Vibrio ulleungensis]
MKKVTISALVSMALLSNTAFAKDVSTLTEYFADDGEITTVENYPVLETARQFVKVQEKVGVNNFEHKRVLTPTDDQPVVRMNRDTYYSMATIDVSKGASVTLPEIPEGMYMSLEVITEDHRIQAMEYGAGTYELSTHTGDHVHIIIRTDTRLSLEEVHALQDKMSIQAGSNNEFTAPQVNKEAFEAVEKDLKAQMPVILKRDGAQATFGMFTDPQDESKELFTEEKYAIGAAIGWGGAQLADNVYEVSGNFPADKCYQATFPDPENQAFWSVTVYNKAGFMFKDVANVSSNTADKNADGTYTVSFGCGPDAKNNLEIDNDSGMFSVAFRHYIPSQKVRDGYRVLPYMKEMK